MPAPYTQNTRLRLHYALSVLTGPRPPPDPRDTTIGHLEQMYEDVDALYKELNTVTKAAAAATYTMDWKHAREFLLHSLELVNKIDTLMATERERLMSKKDECNASR